MSAYKDEKHGTWYVKFSYVDWKGNTRWTTKRGFKGKRAAEKYERYLISLLRRSNPV